MVDDPIQLPLGGEGRGASPVNALGFTVGDALKLKDPQSRVVGVSLKDRSAILMAGRRADAAYWYETAGGQLHHQHVLHEPVLSRGWRNGTASISPDQYAGKPWTRLLADEAVYEKYAGPDAIEGEWDRKDIRFPHAIRGKPPERSVLR